ncbi:hypothetical protein [Indiicoccus explosivorum]|uniref:hypothetical protein n=1 Tax=Indiicoccus explosivorum TaxID=1917864 RepID=UPI000B4479D8|nr:hypothetical protein [Indiicoccus explosivorum]
MGDNLKLGVLLLLLLAAGWAILVIPLPFAREVAFVAGLSVLVMAAVHERYVFLYAMSAILSYGAFLTFYAFLTGRQSVSELPYIYSHLLLTAFLLLYWVLLNKIKHIGYEKDELKRQIGLLQKYTGHSELLTANEFIEQAAWIMKAGERKKEQAWFVEISLEHESRRTRDSLMASLERTIKNTIRQKYDLVTSVNDTIYLLLKDTDEAGAARVVERYHENLRTELNLLEPPFRVAAVQAMDLGQLAAALGRSS